MRVDALVIGPGLPLLSETVFSQLPEEIRMDPVWDDDQIGAYYHQSPADQSTCAHLGPVMAEASTVRNGRCDFHEEWSDTHYWRLMDAEDNVLPVAGGTYYIAAWLQVRNFSRAVWCVSVVVLLVVGVVVVVVVVRTARGEEKEKNTERKGYKKRERNERAMREREMREL